MRTVLAAASALLLGSAALGATAAHDFDIVIRNGRVLDGAGNPWVLADVAIKDGRIARVGRFGGTGMREIDAHGRYVSPGFIDMMDQAAALCSRAAVRRTSCWKA